MVRIVVIVIVAVIVVVAVIFFLPEDKFEVFKPEPTVDVEFDITIFHTKFEPSTIQVSQGDLVRLNVLTAPDTSSLMHGITIDDYGINELATSDTTPTVIKFTADKKGTFSAYCGTCLDGPFGRDVPDKRLTLIVN